jgi:polyhydroxyalkanoate synthesis repressor PhaR
VLDKVKSAVDQKKEPVVIKKYANRRLYNTETSTYVTLDDLAEMVRSERDFIVYDAKSGEDLTHSVLTQIIVEQEGRGSSLLPIPFLRQLIRFYGDNMGAFVPTYLQMSLEALAQQQERYRKHFGHLISGKVFGPIPFGTAAFEAMQEQARQNMAMFERALTMFTPFNPLAPSGGGKKDEPSASGGRAEGGPGDNKELAEMKAQLAAMQARIDKMSGGR